MAKKNKTKQILNQIGLGTTLLTISGSLFAIGVEIADTSFFIFKCAGISLIIASISIFIMGAYLLIATFDLIQIKPTYNLAYATEKKSPVIIKGVMDFIAKTPKWDKPKKSQLRYISKLDQTFILKEVNDGQKRVHLVSGRIIYNWLKIGYQIQESDKRGRNDKPIGGFSLGSWYGIEWSKKFCGRKWRWSKNNWRIVSTIVKLGCIEYEQLTGFCLGSGLQKRHTFKLLVGYQYAFDALCIALLKDTCPPYNDWRWLSEIMPPPN